MQRFVKLIIRDSERDALVGDGLEHVSHLVQHVCAQFAIGHAGLRQSFVASTISADSSKVFNGTAFGLA